METPTLKFTVEPTFTVTLTTTYAPSFTPNNSPEPTITPTLTPTKTPLPEYTVLGEGANHWAELFGWEVVPCGIEIVEENLEKGIFLYRKDTNEYFCNFKGFDEPVPQPELGGAQYLLIFEKYDGENIQYSYKDYIFGFLTTQIAYYPNPSMHNYIDASHFEGVDEKIKRMWPLSYEEFISTFDD